MSTNEKDTDKNELNLVEWSQPHATKACMPELIPLCVALKHLRVLPLHGMLVLYITKLLLKYYCWCYVLAFALSCQHSGVFIFYSQSIQLPLIVGMVGWLSLILRLSSSFITVWESGWAGLARKHNFRKGKLLGHWFSLTLLILMLNFRVYSQKIIDLISTGGKIKKFIIDNLRRYL